MRYIRASVNWMGWGSVVSEMVRSIVSPDWLGGAALAALILMFLTYVHATFPDLHLLPDLPAGFLDMLAAFVVCSFGIGLVAAYSFSVLLDDAIARSS
jgi:hypothetical protein